MLVLTYTFAFFNGAIGKQKGNRWAVLQKYLLSNQG
jgi:hypothetical protein